MSRTIDNLIAFRILYMLVTRFVDTDAYKLGIIDKEGKNLIKSSAFTKNEQRQAYTYLHRLVFKLKWLLNKIPGQESKLANFVGAMWLIKEYYESDSTSLALIEERFEDLISKIDNIILVEEEILVREFLEVLNEDGGIGGAPANAVGNGSGVALDQPFVKKKRKFQAFIVNDEVYNRFNKGKTKYRKWSNYLNLEDDGHRAIYDWAKKNPNGVIVLKNGKEMKAIRFNRNGGGNWNKIKRPTRQINNDII